MTDVTTTLAPSPQPAPSAAAPAPTAHLWIRAFHNGRNKSIRIDNPTTVALATIRRQLETTFQAPASTPRMFRYLEYLGDDERVALRTRDDWMAAIQLVRDLERAHLHVFCVDREEAEPEPDDDAGSSGEQEQTDETRVETVTQAMQADAAHVPLPSSPPLIEEHEESPAQGFPVQQESLSTMNLSPTQESGNSDDSQMAPDDDDDTSQPSPEGPALPLFLTNPTPEPEALASFSPSLPQVEAEPAQDPEPEATLSTRPISPRPPAPEPISPPQMIQPPSTPPRAPLSAVAPMSGASPPPRPIQREQQQPASPAGSTSSMSSTSTSTRKSRRPAANTFVQDHDWNYSSKPGPELRIPDFESKLSLIDDRVVDEPGSPTKPAVKPAASLAASGRDKDRERGRARIRREYEPQQHDENDEEEEQQGEYSDEYESDDADERRDLIVAPPPRSPTKPPPLAIQPRTSSSTSPHRDRASPSHMQLAPLSASASSPTQSQPFVPKSILKKRVSFSADSPKGHEKVPPMDLMPAPQHLREGPTLLTDRIPEEGNGGMYYPPTQQAYLPPPAPASPSGGQFYPAPPSSGGYYLPPPPSAGYWPPTAQPPPSYMPAPYWPPPSALGFAPASQMYHPATGGGGTPTMVLVPASAMYPGAAHAQAQAQAQAYAALPPIVPMSAPAARYARAPGGGYAGEYQDGHEDDYYPPPARPVPLVSPVRTHASTHFGAARPMPAAGSYDPLAKSSYMWHHAHRQQLAAGVGVGHAPGSADVGAPMAPAGHVPGGQARKASAVGTGKSRSRSRSGDGGSGYGR